MNRKIVKRVVLSALTTTAVAASVIGATGASAISPVPCGPSDYLVVTYHDSAGYGEMCLANSGSISLGSDAWITRISTGNNLVQWHGDGSWQPSTPIGKNTVYTWPNNPGGVSADSVRIL
jgi:hypothetical protein